MVDIRQTDPKDVELLFTPAGQWDLPLGRHMPDLWKLGIQGLDRFLFVVVKLINRFAIKIFQLFGLNSHYNIFTDNISPLYGSFFAVFNPITLVTAIFGINVIRSFFSTLGSHTGFPTKLFIQDFGATLGLVAVIVMFCTNPAGTVMWGLNIAYRITVGFAKNAFGMPITPGSNPVVSQLSLSFLVETWTANFHGNIIGTGCESFWQYAIQMSHAGHDEAMKANQGLAGCLYENGFRDAFNYMDGGAGCFADLLLSVLTAICFAGFVIKFSVRVFMSVLRWIVCVFALAWVLAIQAWYRKKFSEMGGNIIACVGNLLATIAYSLFLLIGNLIIVELSASLYSVADPHGNFPEIIIVLLALLYAIGYAFGSMVDKKILSFIESLSKGSKIGNINNALPMQPVKAMRGLYDSKVNGKSSGDLKDAAMSFAMKGVGVTPLGPALQGALLAKRAAGSLAARRGGGGVDIPEETDAKESSEGGSASSKEKDPDNLPAAKVLRSGNTIRIARPEYKPMSDTNLTRSQQAAKVRRDARKAANTPVDVATLANEVREKFDEAKKKAGARTSSNPQKTRKSTADNTGSHTQQQNVQQSPVANEKQSHTTDANFSDDREKILAKRQARRDKRATLKRTEDFRQKLEQAKAADNISSTDRQKEVVAQRTAKIRSWQQESGTGNTDSVNNTDNTNNSDNTEQGRNVIGVDFIRKSRRSFLEFESTGDVREKKTTSSLLGRESFFTRAAKDDRAAIAGRVFDTSTTTNERTISTSKRIDILLAMNGKDS